MNDLSNITAKKIDDAPIVYTAGENFAKSNDEGCEQWPDIFSFTVLSAIEAGDAN